MARPSRHFAPNEREFYHLFEKAGATAMRAAEWLDRMLRDWPESADLARKVLLAEREGDRVIRDIVALLNRTSRAHLDREDITALASALDDVLDFTEEVADCMGLYRIEAPMDQSLQLATVLRHATQQIHLALAHLRDQQGIEPFTDEIHRLENEGDRNAREALASLFVSGTDPMLVIRWKDIFERLKAAIDATGRVADALQSIATKRS